MFFHRLIRDLRSTAMLSLPDVCCQILEEAGDAIILADS
jgi:hypothetical protein